MLVLQFKTVQLTGGNVANQRNEELTTQIQQLTDENNKLVSKIAEYEATIEKYEVSLQEEGNYYQGLLDTVEQTRVFAGLMPMQGPGVVIKVDNRFVKNADEQLIQVHTVQYEDLLKLVNELNASGAEVISINGERFAASTEIRNAGQYIVINTNRYTAPFEIKAIGNADTLEAGMKLLGGVVDELSELLEITIMVDKQIEIPAYEREIVLDYATPSNGK
jgi:uncharacterized protein YlxW (UPF0749 family)